MLANLEVHVTAQHQPVCHWDAGRGTRIKVNAGLLQYYVIVSTSLHVNLRPSNSKMSNEQSRNGGWGLVKVYTIDKLADPFHIVVLLSMGRPASRSILYGRLGSWLYARLAMVSLWHLCL